MDAGVPSSRTYGNMRNVSAQQPDYHVTLHEYLPPSSLSSDIDIMASIGPAERRFKQEPGDANLHASHYQAENMQGSWADPIDVDID